MNHVLDLSGDRGYQPPSSIHGSHGLKECLNIYARGWDHRRCRGFQKRGREGLSTCAKALRTSTAVPIRDWVLSGATGFSIRPRTPSNQSWKEADTLRHATKEHLSTNSSMLVSTSDFMTS